MSNPASIERRGREWWELSRQRWPGRPPWEELTPTLRMRVRNLVRNFDDINKYAIEHFGAPLLEMRDTRPQIDV